MQAIPSPLKCRGYFVTELMVTANPDHDIKSLSKLDFKDLQIESSDAALPVELGERLWRVLLQIRQNVGSDKNAPYNFAITLFGHFEVHPDYPADKVQKMVAINGSSILYGAARQMLQDAMHNGPFPALLLPTVSFNEPAQSALPSGVGEAKAVYGNAKA